MKKILTLALAAALAMSACAKKNQVKPDDLNSVANADQNMNGDSDSGKAMGLQTIHFGYDNYTLDAEAKGILKGNAQIMKDHASVAIQVEGHCDQRGGIQYNVALGEKRANAVKKFMTDMGVKSERITVISFGKEKPVDSAETEEAYAKNRRANFVITSK